MLRAARSVARAAVSTPRALFGQPHPSTHPHLMGEAELVPGIRAEEFMQRRRSLFDAMAPDSALVLRSAPQAVMAHDVHYLYRPEPNFYYMTGCAEPEAIAVFLKLGRSDGRFVLFVRDRDPAAELWDGPRTGLDRAGGFFRADDVYATSAWKEVGPKLLSHRTVVYDEAASAAEDASCRAHPERPAPGAGAASSAARRSAFALVEQLRVVKSAAEVRLMTAAGRCTALAYGRVLSQPGARGTDEARLAATLEFEARCHGAQGLAYPPVVASGCAALTLHYVSNDAPIRAGELVLVDAGAVYHGYCADVTRTFPASGRCTAAQRAVIDAVAGVQRAVVAAVRPGTSLVELYEQACRLTGQAMRALGLPGRSVRRFFPHNIGHWLGMDVHDTPSVAKQTPLRPGMVITVEPGLYIDDGPDVPADLRNLGVRIEDDVLVTEDGSRLLTPGIPATADELEQSMPQS